MKYSVSGRQGLLVGDADGRDALTQLNISSRSSQNALLMPTDDTAEQHKDAVWHDAVMKQSDLMMNVGVAMQLQVAHQPDENVVSQLNIRQRVSGISDDVSHLVQMTDLEVREQCTIEQSDLEDVAKLLSGNGNINLVEINEKFPELDLDDLQKILSDTDSSVSSQSIGVTSYETCMEGNSVFQNGEPNLVMEEPMMSSVVPPVLSSTASGDVMTMSCLSLYSPSPHFTNTQSSVAIPGPLSPTGVTGTILQQLTLDNGNAVDLAISGSVGPPVQLIRYIPPQVYHVLMLGFLEPSYLNCFLW